MPVKEKGEKEKEEEEFDWAELNVKYSFDKWGIWDPYKIPSNSEESEKTEEEKKEREKKEKKIKKVRFFNIKDEEAEIKIKAEAEVPIKKKRKKISYKIEKFSAAVSGVLENLGGFLKLKETP